MPSVNISFTEKAIQSIKRGERGVVALILKDVIPDKNPFTVLTINDIPPNLSAENKQQITLALIGYQKAPKKVVCYVLESTETDYIKAFESFEVEKFDYLVSPTTKTDNQVENVASWIQFQRDSGKKCKAVLPHCKADQEGIINFTTTTIKTVTQEYTTEQYCARIAGLIAGTPLTISCTYAPLNEVLDCERRTKRQMNEAVDAGEFFIFNDGEKVKVARAVNSLTTSTDEKKKQFRKIKIVEAMDMIHDDIVKATQDHYLGKYANSYDNKCLLLSAIDGYFEQLLLAGILSNASISIDIDAQRNYLKEGEKLSAEVIENMSDDEIKVYDTDDKVFLRASIKILDAIEDIELPIGI